MRTLQRPGGADTPTSQVSYPIRPRAEPTVGGHSPNVVLQGKEGHASGQRVRGFPTDEPSWAGDVSVEAFELVVALPGKRD
jgi:hypothetical protein